MIKKYVKPQILSEKFQPQTYVAACYSIECTGPDNNASCSALYDDTNRNGTYDEDIDIKISNPPWPGATFSGCGGEHIVKGEVKPTSYNGLLEMADGSGYKRCYYWLGDVINPNLSNGNLADFHYTDDLGKIKNHSNPNASN